MVQQKNKTAIIIGAGPAGLTAAYELLTRTEIKPVVIEKSESVGGIARTIDYKGNKLDVGGHRFFTKSDRVLNWWLNQLPLQKTGRTIAASSKEEPNPEKDDELFLIRNRKSSILYTGKFFPYPIHLNLNTLKNLGLTKSFRIFSSYLKSTLLPITPEESLEDFYINRFGQELYQTFFKTYSEKVWGDSCKNISADWGPQRAKNLSIGKAILDSINKAILKSGDIAQKKTETSLIEKFLYPKYGPGQLWNKVAKEVLKKGGTILTEHDVVGIRTRNKQVAGVTALNKGKEITIKGDYVFSTMAVKDLMRCLVNAEIPKRVAKIAENLQYRNFIVVGVLLNKIGAKNRDVLEDNWIYIHEPEVNVCRIQIFNNWSPYLVKDPSKVWLGMEYLCDAKDSFWNKTNEKIIAHVENELQKLKFASPSSIIDAVVVKMPKTYPAYNGSYKQFDEVKNYLDQFSNLFLIGRNGMHRYNNQDHSMLTAMVAVDNIIEGKSDKSNIWSVNTEAAYHEDA